MAEAIISAVLEQLISMVAQEMQEEVRLVTGVEKEVKRLTNNLRAIKAVLVDAEQRQVKEEPVRFWLDQLKDASYDMEDVLDEWNTARMKLQIEGVENATAPQKKVCSFLRSPCFGFKHVSLRRDIAHKIKEINENLVDIARAKHMFNFHVKSVKSVEKSERVQTTSLVDESEVRGRDDEKKILIGKLLSESSEEQKGLHIISITGMGGIGKTTLAQLAYNNNEVINTFENRIWVCVSDPFDQVRVAKAIIEGLKHQESNLVELESLIQIIHEFIKTKKFLLVLDDVWEENYNKWEPFYYCLKNGHHESKILITTRKETVAYMMRSTDIVSLNTLTEEECWSLFKRSAFFGRSIGELENFEQIGRKIASKCKGLPLAAKTIGSLLQSKNSEEEWKYILDSEMWELEELDKPLFAPLLLSYNDLPSMVKCCFSYCAIFPKDYEIRKDNLIKLWMAQGYLSVKKNKELEIIGEEYFDILAARSFFQEFEKDDVGNIKWCKMHDIVHDFAQFVNKSECFTVDKPNGLEESFVNSFHTKVCHTMFGKGASFPVSIYKFQRLRSLLIEIHNVESVDHSLILEELFRKLTRLRVLDFRRWVSGSSIREIPTNIEKLVHLRYINLGYAQMEKLPETLCELYNLQILDVSCCGKLKELPQGIGKLINMRHLLNEYTSLRLLPVGIARLTNLRRITMFVHDSQGCTFESLKNLELLRECRLYRLGNVSDVDEAKRLELDKKKNLLVLYLVFDRDRGGERTNEEDEQLLEVLQPPLNLKELCISLYRGSSIFPSWMMSLTNVRILSLIKCQNCEHLPPLGRLPYLEKLTTLGLKSLKKLGDEFLGIESSIGFSPSSSSSSVISFPKLKSLGLRSMNKLEEWDYGIERKGEIMPQLSKLKITNSSKLKALPDYLLRTKTVQTLEILSCPILSKRYGKGTGEDWPKISHIPIINIR